MTTVTNPNRSVGLTRKRSTGVIYVVRWPKAYTSQGYAERVYRTLEGAEKCAKWARSTGRPATILQAQLGTWTVVK
jgi:hypothetical protein